LTYCRARRQFVLLQPKAGENRELHRLIVQSISARPGFTVA
jgi:hypothetical protein